MLALAGLVALWRLRLVVEAQVRGCSADAERGLSVRLVARLGTVALEIEREPGAGRVVGWCLSLFGRRFLEGARLLGTTTATRDAGTRPATPPSRRWWTLQLSLAQGLAWVLQQRPRFRITRLDGRLAVGLDDPAATGELYGLLCTLHALAVTGATIHIEPRFDRALVDANAHVVADLQLVAVALSAAWLALTNLRRVPAPASPLRTAPAPLSPTSATP